MDPDACRNTHAALPQRRDFLTTGILGLLGVGTWQAIGDAADFPAVPTVADLSALTDETSVAFAQGYHTPGDGGGGLFFIAEAADARQALAGSRSRGALWVPHARRDAPWVRFIPPEGAMNVKWFGARGNGQSDDAAPINRAIWMAGYLGMRNTYIPEGTYQLEAPVVLTWTSGCTLQGAGPLTTVLRKEHARPHTLESGREVDAALVIPGGQSADGNSSPETFDTHSVVVKQLGIEGVNVGTRPLERDCGVYVERTYNATFQNLNIAWVKRAFVSDKLWMSRLIRIRGKHIQTLIDLSAHPNRDDVAGASTSLSIENCYCSNDVRGDAFKLAGVYYATLQSCGADEVQGWPYLIDTCRTVNLIGCGFEKSRAGKGIAFRGTWGTMIGCKGIYPRVPTEEGAAVLAVTSNREGRPSSVTVIGAHFSNYVEAENRTQQTNLEAVPGRYVDSGSRLTSITSRFPESSEGGPPVVMRDEGQVRADADPGPVALPSTSQMSRVQGTRADTAINENFDYLEDQIARLRHQLREQ